MKYREPFDFCISRLKQWKTFIKAKNGRYRWCICPRKTVRSLLQSDEFELEGFDNRNGTFEPKIVPKLQLIIIAELEDNMIAVYMPVISMIM